jgi:hypothetical protein
VASPHNGRAIRQVCSQFVVLCRTLGLFAQAGVAIHGSKFKAVNNRDKNFTRAKMQRRMAQIEESVARYLHQLDSADRQEPSLARTTKSVRLTEKIAKLKEEMPDMIGLLAIDLRAVETRERGYLDSLLYRGGQSRPLSSQGSGVLRAPASTG